MLHAHFTAFCGIDAELLGWNFYTAWKRIQTSIASVPVMDLFGSCQLDPLSFIYKLDP